MADIYLAVWGGGYEAPCYAAFNDKNECIEKALEWANDMEEGDTVDVLVIHEDLTMKRLSAVVTDDSGGYSFEQMEEV